MKLYETKNIKLYQEFTFTTNNNSINCKYYYHKLDKKYYLKVETLSEKAEYDADGEIEMKTVEGIKLSAHYESSNSVITVCVLVMDDFLTANRNSVTFSEDGLSLIKFSLNSENNFSIH